MTAKKERNSFIFYRSFYEAIKLLPSEKQLKIYQKIAEFSFENEKKAKKVELDNIQKSIFILIKPQLEANRKRFINGCKKKKSKTEANDKQNGSKVEANLNLNLNDNVNENVNVNPNHNENDFEEFWKFYTPIKCNGKVVGKGSKKEALKKYANCLKAETHKNILLGLKAYLTHCKQNSQLTCSVMTFLNQERWNNEYGIEIVAEPPQEKKSQRQTNAEMIAKELGLTKEVRDVRRNTIG